MRTTAADKRVVGALDWPAQWMIFGPVHADDPVLPPAMLSAMPDQLEIAGKILKPQLVTPGRDSVVTLADIYKDVGRRTTAYVFLPLTVPDARAVTLGLGGNWWMQAWLNGALILDTTETSNIHGQIAVDNHLVNVNLRPGRNILAVRFICGSGGSELALGGPDQIRRAWAPPRPAELDMVQTLWDAALFDEKLSAHAGTGLRLQLERDYLRPGERFLEYFLWLTPAAPMAETRLRETVFDFATGRQIQSAVITPSATRLLRQLDLRTLGLDKVRLRVELSREDRLIGTAEAVLRANRAAPAPAAGQTIPVLLDMPAGIDSIRDWPVTFGMPFPAGGLWELDDLRVVDRAGADVPFQAEITGRWAPEGAIKWVRFDALADSARGLAVTTGAPGPGARPPAPVTLVKNAGGVEVDTGAARYQLEGGGALIGSLRAAGQVLIAGAGRGLYVIDQRGRTATADAKDALMEVEAAGPVAACVKIEGVYRTPDGEELARHITRLEFFAGRPEARVIHTLVLTRDSNAVWFREIGWEIPVAPGPQPQALFNVNAADAAQCHAVSLADATNSAYLLQAQGLHLTLKPHPRQQRWIPQSQGQYVCTLAALERDRQERVLFEGERMGDWMALTGRRGGLLMACRDTARQHPKEFEVFADKMVLRLFSNRGGAELDFRSKTLVQRWGLTALGADELDPAVTAKIAAHDSNAIGWSRTHALLIAPLPAEQPAPTAARLGRLHTGEVFAHTDPAWIYRSRAMGPLYPKDPARFPEAEKAVEYYMRICGTDRTPGDIYHGFVDYFTGPHYTYPQRWYQVYDLLTCYWTVYARSGDRAYRRTAQGAVRAYMDAWLAHCDGPRKVRGLIMNSGGESFTGKSSLPYYWETTTGFDWGNGTDLKRVLWDYQLTGYRRSRDIVRNYGDGLLRAWHPDGQVFNALMVVRLLYQVYELTWDPRLRALAEATNTQRFYNPLGDMRITKNRAYKSTTYKTAYDVDIPVEVWELTGGRCHLDVAVPLAEYQWRKAGLGGRATGLAANFLYYHQPNPALAADLAHFLRREPGAAYQPETGEYVGVTWSNIARYLRGLVYAMDVVAATDADRRPPAALLDFEFDDPPCSVFLYTDAEQATELLVRMPGASQVGQTGEGLLLIPHAFHNRQQFPGQELHQVNYISGGGMRVRIPYDAMPGAYEIRLAQPGAYQIIADRRTPLVIHRAGVWQPAFTMPATRVYFRVPQGVTDARIWFENGAVLFAPDGRPHNDGTPVRGWCDLPADRPGLWGFDLAVPGKVEGRNFPPFYTMGDPEFYFEPQLAAPGVPPQAESQD